MKRLMLTVAVVLALAVLVAAQNKPTNLQAGPMRASVVTTPTSATLAYTAPSTSACTLQVSTSQTFSPLVYDGDPSLFTGANSDLRGANTYLSSTARTVDLGRYRMLGALGASAVGLANDGKIYSRTLAPNTTHYFKLTCGSVIQTGAFKTLPLPGAGVTTCTTATYIDKDCDGYGVGVKATGVYPITDSQSGYTTGDLPDADDEDATVNTTASWQSKWGSTNAGLVSFLQQRKGVPSASTARIYYIASTGSDATGAVNDPSRPYRTPNAARLALHDLQGGVLVLRGGTTDASFSACGNGGACYGFTGTASRPVYIMAYPGEKVETAVNWSHNGTPGQGYWPVENMRYVTVDGIVWNTPNWNQPDAIVLTDADHITVRNCEFAGWHQIMFNNHSEDILIEQNVFHDMGYHAIYFGYAGMGSAATVDFDFAADAAAYAAGTSLGASYRGRVLNNVFYCCGYSGYEAVHINALMHTFLIEGNIISYCSGGIGIQTGVYYLTIRNNAIFDNGTGAITLSLYTETGSAAHTLRYITIENNLLWSGLHTDTMRPAGNDSYAPAHSIKADDGSAESGHWIKDVVVRNNFLICDNYDSTPTLAQVHLGRNTYPNTWTFTNNQFWGTNTSPSASDKILFIKNTAYPDGHDAGGYTLAQASAYVASWTGNLFANPNFTAASTAYRLTPWLFNFTTPTTGP